MWYFVNGKPFSDDALAAIEEAKRLSLEQGPVGVSERTGVVLGEATAGQWEFSSFGRILLGRKLGGQV